MPVTKPKVSIVLVLDSLIGQWYWNDSFFLGMKEAARTNLPHREERGLRLEFLLELELGPFDCLLVFSDKERNENRELLPLHNIRLSSLHSICSRKRICRPLIPHTQTG